MLATFEGYDLNIKNVKITSNIKYETQADDISKKKEENSSFEKQQNSRIELGWTSLTVTNDDAMTNQSNSSPPNDDA